MSVEISSVNTFQSIMLEIVLKILEGGKKFEK